MHTTWYFFQHASSKLDLIASLDHHLYYLPEGRMGGRKRYPSAFCFIMKVSIDRLFTIDYYTYHTHCTKSVKENTIIRACNFGLTQNWQNFLHVTQWNLSMAYTTGTTKTVICMEVSLIQGFSNTIMYYCWTRTSVLNREMSFIQPSVLYREVPL